MEREILVSSGSASAPPSSQSKRFVKASYVVALVALVFCSVGRGLSVLVTGSRPLAFVLRALLVFVAVYWILGR